MSRLKIETKYMFEIDAPVVSKPLGEVPEGFRLELELQTGAKAKTDKSRLDEDWPTPSSGAPEWTGLDGELISGGDWITVQSNGVIRFNGRATIRTAAQSPSKHPLLIDVLYAGSIDLADGKDDQGRTRYGEWRRGALARADLPIALAANFELAWRGEQWALKAYKNDPAAYARYARLGRAQYIAVGSAQLTAQAYSPITHLRLEIHEAHVRARPAAGGQP